MDQVQIVKEDPENSGLYKHAVREFKAAGWLNNDGSFCDEIQGEICIGALALLEVLSGQGHSGSSINYMLSIFNRLALFKPLAPLTGNDDEWVLVSEEEGLYQSNRCSTVFKNKEGECFDIGAKVFIDPDGFSYTNTNSKVYIDFPYNIPDSPEYVHVDLEGNEVENK